MYGEGHVGIDGIAFVILIGQCAGHFHVGGVGGGVGNTVNADVTFTVHLGYADGNPNDYDTRRNTRYIYTVTLRGINDIRLEVESDGEENEQRPGYEGNVIFSQDGLYELDARPMSWLEP